MKTTANVTAKPQNPWPQVKAEVVYIDPKWAMELIESNAQNQRAIAQNNLCKITRCINEEAFVLNGEPIIVSTTNRLLNGQHRMHGVVNSGRGIWTVLVTGVPDEFFHTIDCGRSRSFANVLQIYGDKSAVTVSTTLQRLAEYFDDPQSLGFCRPVPTTELFEIRKAYPEIYNSVCAVTGCKSAISTSRLAWLHALVHERFPAKMAGFLGGLADGVFDESYCERTVNPVYLLRERALANRASAAKWPIRYALAIIVVAWNAHLEGRPLRVLRWSEGQEFPLLKGAFND